jgi:NADH-quinone oxidoreductase subunit E
MKGVSIEKILLESNSEVKNLFPALKKISAVFGYVSEVDAQKTADYFSVPLSQVYETASFYNLIKIEKSPTLVIQICSSANCAVNNAFKIIREIENALKIKAGDKFNPRIRLETISCLGRCQEGPIMVVNDKIYENITVSSVHNILKEWL